MISSPNELAGCPQSRGFSKDGRAKITLPFFVGSVNKGAVANEKNHLRQSIFAKK